MPSSVYDREIRPRGGKPLTPKQKTKPPALDDLRPAAYNPRKIDAESLAGLGVSLREFGDISGLVWNSRTGNLVAGHQRLAALKAEYGDELAMDGEAVVAPTGERFPVRVVDWDEKTEKAANVAANNPHIAGEFLNLRFWGMPVFIWSEIIFQRLPRILKVH